MAHVLVIANETVASQTLLDAVRAEAHGADDRVTVIAPVNEPNQGYVVYEDTRRAAAGRRLEKTLKVLREAGLRAQGFVVETGPVQAVKDALAQLEPPVDEIVVSTHGAERSGWMRRNVVEDIERAAGSIPVKHVVVEPPDARTTDERARDREPDGRLGAPCSRRSASVRQAGPARFLIVSPQSDDEQHDDADRRLRLALTELRGEGIEAHGQVVHPDPYTAAKNVVHDERVDEIIVSTFPGERSGLAAARPGRAAAQGHGPSGRARGELRMSVHAAPLESADTAVTGITAAADPLQLAHAAGGARHVPVHRVGDHALRLVLHGLLLRPGRELRRHGHVAAAAVSSARRSSPASTR